MNIIDEAERAQILAFQGGMSALESSDPIKAVACLIALYQAVVESVDEIAARERDCGSRPVIAERLRRLL